MMVFLGFFALSFLMIVLWMRNRLLLEAPKVLVAVFAFGLLGSVLLGYTVSETAVLIVLFGVSAFCFSFLLFGPQNKRAGSLHKSAYTGPPFGTRTRVLTLLIIVLLTIFGPLKFIWERLDVIYTFNPVLMRIYESEARDFSAFLSSVLFFLCCALFYMRAKFRMWLLIPFLLSFAPGLFDFAKSALLVYLTMMFFSIFRMDNRSKTIKLILTLVLVLVFLLISVLIQMQLHRVSGARFGTYVQNLIVVYSVKPIIGLDLVAKNPDFLNTNNYLVGAQSLWIVHRIFGPILSYSVPSVVLPFLWVEDGWLNIFTAWGIVFCELGFFGVLAYGFFNGGIMSLLLRGMKRDSYSLYNLMNTYIIVNIVMALGNPVFSWLSFWIGIIVIEAVDVILRLTQRRNSANNHVISSVQIPASSDS